MYLALMDIDTEHRSIIILVVSKANIDRMRGADPITLMSTMEGGYMPVPRYCQISFVLAYEEDWEALEKVATPGKPGDLLRYLKRGYKFREDLGDGKTGWKI